MLFMENETIRMDPNKGKPFLGSNAIMAKGLMSFASKGNPPQ